MKYKVKNLIVFIIQEIDFYLLLNEINYDEKIKENLINIVKNYFTSFCNLSYSVFNNYYNLINYNQNEMYLLNEKDINKINEIEKFVESSNIFIIDSFDYLYSIANFYRDLNISDDFCDIIYSLLTNYNLNTDDIYEYLNLIQILFENIVFSLLKINLEEDNLVFGIDLSLDKERLYLIVYNGSA